MKLPTDSLPCSGFDQRNQALNSREMPISGLELLELSAALTHQVFTSLPTINREYCRRRQQYHFW
jgi:hypothetical protein